MSINLTTGKVNWRFAVSGYRSDHMAVSPDGTKVAVSASLSKTVHVLDINTGEQLGKFSTGDKPHENIWTDGGKYIWNMSIGNVETDLDDPALDWTKGDRHITVVDAGTYKVVKTIDMRARLDAFGRKDLSNAVRPAVFSPTSPSSISRSPTSTASWSTTSPPTRSPGSGHCPKTRPPATTAPPSSTTPATTACP